MSAVYTIRDVVVLACSRKHNEFCVAGMYRDTGALVRLVPQGNPHGAVPDSQITYPNSSKVQVLDVIRVHVGASAPLAHQPENVEYSTQHAWDYVGKCDMAEVLQKVKNDPDSNIFFDTNKKISSDFFSDDKKVYSLKFITLDAAKLIVESKKNGNEIQHRLSFKYNNRYYNYLAITDSKFESTHQVIGEFELKNIHLLLSLGEKYIEDDCHYKLVAAIHQ